MKNYSLMDLKKTSSPKQFAYHLREMGDIFFWEQGNFWVITDYDLAKSTLLSEDFSCDRSPFFVSRMPQMNLQLIQDFFHVVSNMMVMSDKPEHTKRRRICYQGFGTKVLNTLEPLIDTNINEAMVKFKNERKLDFLEELAIKIPSTTLADFFAIPLAERMDFYQWSNNMTQFFGGSTSYHDEDGIKVNTSAKNLQCYFSDLIKERKKNPKDDFLSILLQNQHHFALTDDEIISQAIMMLVAGQVTTTDQMANNLYQLVSNEQDKKALIENLHLVDNYIEECNRLDPAVTFIFRVTKNDTQIGTQAIKKGDVIFISSHAVNRCPKTFGTPNKIDIDVNKAQHFSYGFGSHFCLGAKLARIEMSKVFHTLFNQFPTLAISKDAPPVRKHHSLSFSGFESFDLVV
jgi:cytochrome P450